MLPLGRLRTDTPVSLIVHALLRVAISAVLLYSHYQRESLAILSEHLLPSATKQSLTKGDEEVLSSSKWNEIHRHQQSNNNVDEVERNDLMERYAALKIGEHNYDSVWRMHFNSYATAVKALIGHLGREHYKVALAGNDGERKRLSACLAAVNDEEKKKQEDVMLSAQCLLESRRRWRLAKAETNKEAGHPGDRPSTSSFEPREPPQRVLNIRPIPRGHYANSGRPIAAAAGMSLYANYLQPTKKRGDMMESRRKEEALVHTTASVGGKNGVRQMARMEKLRSGDDAKSPLKRVLTLIRHFAGAPIGAVQAASHERSSTATTDKSGPKDWRRTYDSLLQIKQQMEEKLRQPGASVHQRRMYDLVVVDDSPPSPKNHRALTRRQSDWSFTPALGDQPRVLSPRIMPLVPPSPSGKGNAGSILSPSIFALYEPVEGEDAIAPLPRLLDAAGLASSSGGEGERETIMTTLMEASGADELIESAEKMIKHMDSLAPEVSGPIIEATERMAAALRTLEDSFTTEQTGEFHSRGRTFLNRAQMERLLFADQNILHLRRGDVDLNEVDRLARMSPAQREDALWATVEHIASSVDSHSGSRKKRQTAGVGGTDSAGAAALNISVGQTVLLSPYMFSPTYGLSVLGGVVLSPFIFSPLVMNPSAIAPIVLAPFFTSPLILSPYVLGPFVLSPYGMSPFVLTPYVLSPNILNPYMMSPMILSPIAISPNILSPGVLSPSVLSPTFLSPELLSNSSLNPAILSPSFLS